MTLPLLLLAPVPVVLISGGDACGGYAYSLVVFLRTFQHRAR